MKNYLLPVIAALCFAVVGVSVKSIGGAVPVMTVISLRMLIGFLFLLVIVPFIDRNVFRVSRKDLKDYFVIGLLMALGSATFVTANFLAPVQNVSLIVNVAPFLVLILAYFMLREKITRKKIIALVIASVGLLIINPFQASDFFNGHLFALANAVFGALLIVKMRKEGKNHSIGSVLWFMFFAMLVTLPLPFIYGFGDVGSVIFPLLVLGTIGTGFAFFFLNYALERVEAEEVSIISMISGPLFAITLAVLLIGEVVNSQIILGGAILVGAGVFLEVHRKQLREMKQKIEQKIEKAEYKAAVIEVKAKREVFEAENAIEDKLHGKKSD